MNFQENQNQTDNKKDLPNTARYAVGGFVLDLLLIVGITMAIILPFRFFVAEPYVVSGNSMIPNFHDGEYLVVDKLTYRKHKPSRGDVIVLKYPKAPKQFFIKRIIGLPGDSIEIQQGYVTLFTTEYPAGYRLSESYLENQNETVGRVEKMKLGSDEYFVLGDNRSGSSDSRLWGILPGENIVGRAWLRVLPLGQFGVIHNPKYEK